jgi:hypothetical protein
MVPSLLISHAHDVGSPLEISVNFTASGTVPVVTFEVNAITGALDEAAVPVIYPDFAVTFHPWIVVAFRETVNDPAYAYVCAGCWSVEKLPSLNDQFQLVGEPVDWSVNWTVSCAGPEVGLAENAATGPAYRPTTAVPLLIAVGTTGSPPLSADISPGAKVRRVVPSETPDSVIVARRMFVDPGITTWLVSTARSVMEELGRWSGTGIWAQEGYVAPVIIATPGSESETIISYPASPRGVLSSMIW